MHTPFSPYVVQHDCYLILTMAHDFGGEKFATREAYEIRMSQFNENLDEFFMV